MSTQAIRAVRKKFQEAFISFIKKAEISGEIQDTEDS